MRWLQVDTFATYTLIHSLVQTLSCFHILTYPLTYVYTRISTTTSELRKPLISASAYRAVVYVGEAVPIDWKHIAHTYDDVFWIRGNMLNSADFNRAHIKTASSVVLFANRENLTVMDKQS